MRVILYVASTPNGYIATSDDEVYWSDAENEAWYTYVKRAGNLIIGRRTFELMRDSGDLVSLSRVKIAVVSTKEITNDQIVCMKSVQDAVDYFVAAHAEEVVIGGGGELNGSALSAGVVDEVLIDLEPLLFTKGIPMIGKGIQEHIIDLELLHVNKFSDQGVQLRYKVKGMSRG